MQRITCPRPILWKNAVLLCEKVEPLNETQRGVVLNTIWKFVHRQKEMKLLILEHNRRVGESRVGRKRKRETVETVEIRISKRLKTK